MVDDKLDGPPPAPAVTAYRTGDPVTEDAVDYDPETDTYRASFDGATDSACLAVISTVATVAQREPTDLQPLHSVIDPDALDVLMRPDKGPLTRGDVDVSFTLDGYDVTVHSYGVVSVHAPADRPS